MKAKNVYLTLVVGIAAGISFTACSGNKQQTTKEESAAVVVDAAHNSRNALDYEGVYAGTLPCADCPGIYTEITLSGDRYTMKTVYQDEAEGENTFEESGTYSWDASGSRITLNTDPFQQYQVGENLLFVLDSEGERVTGELANLYILRKK